MPLLLRRGPEANRASFTPADGELIVTTDQGAQRLYIGDGVTPGGNLISGGGGGGGAFNPTINDVIGLPAALASKANLSHTHAISEVEGLSAALAGLGQGVQRNLGNVTGTVTLDAGQAFDVAANARLTGDITLAVSNLAANGTTVVTVKLQQDATGGRSVTFPANSTFLNGSTPDIDPAPNSFTLLTLVYPGVNGGPLVAVSDTRATRFEPLIVNPPANGSYYVTFPFPVTLDLANTVTKGSGAVSFAVRPSAGGSFTSVSGVTSLAAGDVLRATVSNFSSFFTFAVPRTA